MRRLGAGLFLIAAMALLLIAATPNGTAPESRLSLTPCRVQGVKEKLQCGTYHVFENRRTRTGRTLPLKIVVIPAQKPHPERGPIFYMAGGPGETATELADLVVGWGQAEEQDVVIVDERGTGEGHRLDCKSPGSDNNLEVYLNGPFVAEAARACRDELQKNYDLSQYTTANFADDIDEVRAAMGYDKININGGSFGTYAGLIYMRRHPERVRTAYFTSVVTPQDRVPLYHARGAQMGLDRLFRECEEEAECRAAYPRLREDFEALIKKVRERPATTSVDHPVTGAPTQINLTERMFVDAVRVLMYRVHNSRQIPFFVKKAVAGDFKPFAEAGLRANRGIYSSGRMGLHYAITCNEFVSRIRPEEIDEATAGSFLGQWRVRAQMAACQEWPRTELPPDFFEPFSVDMPAVLVWGAADPASSPPNWAGIAKSYMPNGVQLVVEGAGHTPENPCTKEIRHALFRSGTTAGLDTSCMTNVPRPKFRIE